MGHWHLLPAWQSDLSDNPLLPVGMLLLASPSVYYPTHSTLPAKICLYPGHGWRQDIVLCACPTCLQATAPGVRSCALYPVASLRTYGPFLAPTAFLCQVVSSPPPPNPTGHPNSTSGHQPA